MQTKPVKESNRKYRWRYEMNLFENPTIFLLVAKVLFGAVIGTMFVIGLICLIMDGFSRDSLFFTGKLTLIMLGIFAVLLIVGFLVYAAIMGGKYIVNFEMDEKQVIHAQSKKQAQRAEWISTATVMMGRLARNRGAVSAGMLSSGRHVSTTEFDRVKKVIVNKKRSVIKLRSFGWNEVYADGDDFDFVANWIRSHVPQTVEWIVKS